MARTETEQIIHILNLIYSAQLQKEMAIDTLNNLIKIYLERMESTTINIEPPDLSGFNNATSAGLLQVYSDHLKG